MTHRGRFQPLLFCDSENKRFRNEENVCWFSLLIELCSQKRDNYSISRLNR